MNFFKKLFGKLFGNAPSSSNATVPSKESTKANVIDDRRQYIQNIMMNAIKKLTSSHGISLHANQGKCRYICERINALTEVEMDRYFKAHAEIILNFDNLYFGRYGESFMINKVTMKQGSETCIEYRPYHKRIQKVSY